MKSVLHNHYQVKKYLIYFLAITIFLLSFSKLQAQCTGTTIVFNWGGGTVYTYQYNGMVNGKCSYLSTVGGGTVICWSGTQWNICGSSTCGELVTWHSAKDVGDRPSGSVCDWVADRGIKMNSLTGTGTITPLTAPSFTVTGTLTALTTVSGTASTNASFIVSGTNMTGGITVTAPAGFEVSLLAGSGFANNIVVGAAGTIATTTVYVRLKASNGVRTYNGNVVLSSPCAANVNVSASGTVSGGSTITSVSSLTTFSKCEGSASAAQNFTVSGSSLTDNLVISAPTNFEISTSLASGYAASLNLTPVAGAVASSTIYVRLTIGGNTASSGNIVLSSTGATSKNIAVTGTVNSLPTMSLSAITPVLTSSTSFALPYTSVTGSPDQYSIAAIATKPLSGFTNINNAVLTASPLNVPIPASASGQYTFSATLRNNSTGCSSLPASFTLNITNPAVATIASSGTLGSFNSCSGLVSANQNFSLLGTNLTSNITVTAPAGFEVSTAAGSGYASSISLAPTGGTVATSPIYVRLSANATGSPTGNISLTATGATTQTVAVSGVVNALPSLTAGAVSGVLVSSNFFNLPYSAVLGSPDKYSITQTASPLMTGFTAITNAVLPTSPINVPIPASSANTYSYSLSLTNSVTGCVSTPIGFSVTVNPLTPTVSINGQYTAESVCSGISSAAQKIQVSGSNLTGNILISAPSGFEVSASQNSGFGSTVQLSAVSGAVAAKDLFVRVSSTASGNLNANLTVSSTNATSASLPLLATVNVIPTVPVVTGAGPLSFCSGESVVLNSNKVAGNQWYRNGSLINAAVATSYTVQQEGTYTVKYTDNNNCSSTSVGSVVVINANPTATIAQGSQLAFTNCANTSINLSANTGTGLSYQWSNAQGTINAATSATYTVTDPGTYTVRVTNANNCSAVSSSIKILATPSANATGSTSVCAGNTIALSANASGFSNPTYQWQLGGVNISNATNATYSATSSGNYTVTITSGATTSTSCPVSVTVTTLPAVSISASPQSSVCAGTPVSAIATAATATGYQWLLGGNAILNANAGNLSIQESGSYSVRVTDANGCSNTSSATSININPKPTLSSNTGNVSVIGTASTNLLNNTADGIWTSSNPAIATVNANSGTVTGVTSGSVDIIYTVTNSSGCKATAVTPFTVLDATNAPTISAATATSFCSGGSVQLNALNGEGYQWMLNGNIIQGATNNSYTATSGGTYTVTALAPDGYSRLVSNAIVVSVNANPLASIQEGSLLAITNCNNSSINLSSAAIGNLEYQWLNEAGEIGNAFGQTYSVTQAGNYRLRVTNQSGCSSISAVTKILAAPVASGNASTAVCSGATVQLSVDASDYTNPTYQWKLGAVNISGATSATYNATATGNYTVVVSSGITNATSCPITVTVNSLPSVSISATAGNTVCVGLAVAISSNAATATAYQWLLNGNEISGATSNNFNADNTGTYSLRVTDANGCINTSSGIQATINSFPDVAPVAGNGTVCIGSRNALTSQTTGGVWTSSNAAIATIDASGMVTGIGSGNATLNYTVTTNGCATTKSKLVTVNPLTNITTQPVATLTQCVNTDATISVNATGTNLQYQWFLNGTAIDLAVTSEYAATNIQLTNAGSYAVTVTGACGDVTSSTSVWKINPLTSISSQPIALVQQCAGTSISLNVQAQGNALSYQWFKDNIAITGATNSSYIKTGLQPADNGNYKVVVSGSCGSAISSNNTVMTISALPTVAAITGTQQVCVGSAVTFANTTGSGNWSSSNISVASISNAGVVTGVAAGTATISYTVTNSGGCITLVQRDITVNALPVLSSITGTQQVCVASSVTFANSTGSGIWSSSNTSVASISSLGVVTGVSAGIATISYTFTNTSGCTSVVTRDVTVNALPVVAAIIGTQQVCSGLTTAFTNATTGGVWSSGTTSVATISTTGVITGVSTGTSIINYTVTNASGCLTAVSRTVTVNALPTVTVSASPTNVSKGLNTQLTAIGSAGTTYQWTPAGNLNDATIANPIARVTENTTYIVTVTNAQGCTQSGSVNVSIKEDLYVDPVIVFTPNADGINDKFVIKNLDQYPVNRLQVFDRTGKVLYETNNYSNNWDGTVNGKLLVKDSYFYILTIKGTIVKRGTITLVR